MEYGMGVMADSFNPNTRGQRQVDLYEFKVSLVHTASSRPTRAYNETLTFKEKLNSFLNVNCPP